MLYLYVLIYGLLPKIKFDYIIILLYLILIACALQLNRSDSDSSVKYRRGPFQRSAIERRSLRFKKVMCRVSMKLLLAVASVCGWGGWILGKHSTRSSMNLNFCYRISEKSHSYSNYYGDERVHKHRSYIVSPLKPSLLRHRWGVGRAQNTCRHAALCCADAVTCRDAFKMWGKCAARLAAMRCLSKSFEIGGKVHVKLTTNHNIYFHFYMRFVPPKVRGQIIDFPSV